MVDMSLRERLTDVAPTSATWPSAVRRGGVMALILVVGVAGGHFEAALAATTGALNIALLDVAVPRAVLARALALCVVTTTVVGFAAVLVGGSWWVVPFLGALAFLQGALAGAGVAVANATIANMITAILLSVVPGGLGQASFVAGWLAVGAAIESVVALVAWRWERQGLVRRQVAGAIRARRRGDPDSCRRWVAAARTTMASAGFDEAETAGFGRLLDAVESPTEFAEPDLRAAERRLRRLTSSSEGPLSETVPAADHGAGIGADAILPRVADRWRHVRSLVVPGTVTFDAGLRMAVLVTVGAVVVEVADVPQGHWVLLVFALAVRPDYSGTLASLVARAIGVVAGVAAVGAVVTLTDGSVPVQLVVAAVAGVLACRWLMGNAVLFFFWLTVFVSVLVDVADPGAGLGPQRIIATLIGVGIGLVVSALWPGWRRAARD